MTGKGFIRVPNSLIMDKTMHYSTKEIYVRLLSHFWRGKKFQRSEEKLAKLTGYSRNTLRQAMRELEELGYIRRNHRYKWSAAIGRYVHDAAQYAFCIDLSDGYTVIPRSILSKELKPSEFVTLLELYHSAGNSGRCFPSLNALAQRLDTVKAAVCRCIRGLLHALTLNRLRCKKRNRAFASNSYYLIDHIFRGGGIIFEQHSSIKQIT